MAAVNIIFAMIFGHTDLRISLPRAKFDEEADFEVLSDVAPLKPHLLGEKQHFRSKIFAENLFSVKFSNQYFRFSLTWRGFGRSTAERPSKSASSSNFALDKLIQRSLRPKNLGFVQILGSPKNFHHGCGWPFSLSS